MKATDMYIIFAIGLGIEIGIAYSISLLSEDFTTLGVWIAIQVIKLTSWLIKTLISTTVYHLRKEMIIDSIAEMLAVYDYPSPGLYVHSDYPEDFYQFVMNDEDMDERTRLHAAQSLGEIIASQRNGFIDSNRVKVTNNRAIAKHRQAISASLFNRSHNSD
ncbi:MAG: hypothetical protein K9M17_03265 [Mariprofundaceae bacterium]|nr:hypothetical protein [Mariprofundaceae bacterium]